MFCAIVRSLMVHVNCGFNVVRIFVIVLNIFRTLFLRFLPLSSSSVYLCVAVLEC